MARTRTKSGLKVGEIFRNARGIDREGNERRFTVFVQKGGTFSIHNDRHYIHHAHGSRRLTEEDVISEIMVVFDVRDVRLSDPRVEARLGRAIQRP